MLLKNPKGQFQPNGVRRIAGVDEAGRGPWAGPVVAAAVILRTAPLPVRVDDSKRLTSAQRDRAFGAILRHAEVGFGIASVDEIDRMNILQATLLAMRRALLDLPTPAEAAVIDGPFIPDVPMPCQPIVHGDRLNYAISCASIVAKVFRDRLMAFYHDLAPAYGFRQHKGYGTALHAERLTAFGPSVFHRASFEPVRRSLLAIPHEALVLAET